ncbi:MAG: FAD binding domain-containing protein [Pseudomonadota bacterium]
MPIAVDRYASLDEAARAASADRGARYLAGGTTLMRAVNDGDLSVTRLVRTTDPGLRSIRSAGATIEIGAGATMADVLANRELSVLHPVARTIGGPAVRQAATVGGNLFAEPPYGDFAGALLALGASATPAGYGSVLPIEELLAARAQGRAGGIVASIAVPRPAEGAFLYKKVTRVKPKGVSVMSIAALVPVSAGRVQGARISFNGMGPTPLRAKAAERALEGQSLDASGVAAACAACLDGLDPQDDALASAWWRREVAPVHLRRLLTGEG